ncbi:alpha/beta hydrolase [Nonomuraea angiospora]|uniref:alpha/beta hydrolase n=1 Tax=Nonomuraea angiospora TaxID=46172 RepID=UPI0029BEF4A8|nr:alpha/beta hydrolase [Nonomuraea angiospora]MDX3110677.1 alpha/beta hydrolase [Nonomuraea angiospora]
MLRNLLLAGLVTVGALVAWPGQPSGRLVRVYGDLSAADRVAVIVPGADTTVATFDDGTKRPGGAARALLAEAARLAPHERLAAVAWLGYDSPPTLSLGVLTNDAAAKGARALRRTVTELHTRTPAPIALLCHSYGSVLCAKAVPGLPVTDLAVFGSPGLDAPSAAALTHPARNAETAEAVTLSAPTANTTLGMKGEHATQGTRDPTDPYGTTNLLDTQPPASVEGAQGAVTGARVSPLRIWAGLGKNDWIRFVPKVKLGPVGFGTDPTSPSFGARVFAVGSGGHSDYFTPGTPSLRNLTLIALGHEGEVTS